MADAPRPTPRRRMVDMAALRAVDPARMYSCKEVAAILGRSVDWAQGKAAGLVRERRAGKFGPDYQVPGSEVLALSGSLVAIATPVETETETETDAEALRRDRADVKRALDACRRKR